MATAKPGWLTLAPLMFLFLWSGGYIAAKSGLLFAEPMTLLVIRYSCVLVIMAVLFVVMRPPLPERRNDWVHLAMVGFLIQAVYFGLCYMAFKSGLSVGVIALILSLQPIIVGIVAPEWTREKVGVRRWAGLFLGLLGAVFVILSRSEINPPTATGVLYAVLALSGITAGTLWEKRFGKYHHPVTANLVGYTAGLAGVLPFMFVLETMRVEWTWGLGFSLIYLVIGNSVIAVGLLLAMIRAGDVGRVSALFFLVPPLAALLAWGILGEVMPVIAWIGLGIATIGVFIATREHVK